MADMQALTISIIGQQTVTPAANAAMSSLNALEGAATRGIGAFANLAASAAKTALAVGAIGAGAVVAGMTNAIGVAATFEQQLSAIAAVSSKTEVELVGGMKAISAAALELGKSTSFSATEAAAGMEEMVKAGVSLKDVMGGGAKAVLDLAAAGALEVAEAATIASGAMNAFALSGKDLPKIADTLANAASASATDVHQLGLGLAAVGAVAHTVGLSFEDTTTALAMFAQAGLKGSDSGTSFKQMLLSLTPSTKPAIATMKELGIITADGANQFFDAQGKVKDFASISGILQKATAGLTQEQKISALQTMFGTDAIRVAAIMAEKGAEGATKLADAQKEVGGAAAVAKERLNNLKGAIEALSGSWEVVRIKIGTPFLPILTKAAQALTKALNNAEPAISAFAEKMAAGLDKMIERATKAAPALVAFGTAALTMGRSLVTLAQAQIPRVVAGFEQIRDFFAGGGLASGASGLAGGLAGAFKDIEPILARVGQQIVTNVTDTFTYLTTRVLPPLVSMIQQIATVLDQTLLPAAAASGAVMRGIFGDTLDWLANEVMPPFLSIIEQTANYWTQVILPTIPVLAAALRTTLGETVQWLATDVWPKLRVAAEAAWGFISGTLIPEIPGAVRLLRDLLGGALQWLADTGWPALVKGATAAWKFLQDNVIPVIRDTVDWLRVKLPEAINTVVSTFETIKGKIGPIVEQALNGDIVVAIKNLGSAFAEFATLATGWIGEQVAAIDWGAVWARAVDIATALGTYVTGLAVDFATWLGEQVAAIPWTSVWQNIVNAAATLLTYLQAQAIDFATWLGQEAGKIPWAVVWTSIKQAAETLATYLQTLVVDFATWLGQQVALIDWDAVWAETKLTATQVIDAIATAVGRLDAELTRWLQTQLETTDWSALGVSFGQLFGGAVVTGGQTAVDELGPQLKPEKIRAALGAFFTGVFSGMWSEIGPAISKGLQGAIDAAMRAVTPTRPNWWPTRIPFPFGPQPGGGMEFPAAPGSSVNPSSGGGGNVTAAPGGPIDNSSREAFVRTAYPYFLQAAKGDKGLAERRLAMAISENGDVGGGGEFIGNNFGGIKGKHPVTGRSFTANTWEDYGNGRVNIQDEFVAYDSPQEGINALGEFLESNPRYRPALDEYNATGDSAALIRGIHQAGYATDPVWPDKIESIRRNTVEPVTRDLPNKVGQATKVSMPTDMANFGQSQAIGNQFEIPGLSAQAAAAACGPAAAMLFMQATGRTPNAQEAMQIASANGWTPGEGMTRGPAGFKGMLSEMGVDYATLPNTAAAAAQSAQAGNLTAISTGGGNVPLDSGHYFVAQGFNPETGEFDLGETAGGPGGALKGGSRFMTAAQIEALAGPINGVIQLVGQAGQAFTQMSENVGTATQAAVNMTPALAGIGASIDPVVAGFTEGTTSVTTMTDAIIASASQQGIATAASANYSAGLITQEEALKAVLGGFAATTPAAAELLTQLEHGTITTDQAAVAFAGLATTTAVSTGAIATAATTMGTEVLAQFGLMSEGATVATTTMGTNTLTTVTDTAGNIVTTWTDAAGTVIDQTLTMADGTVTHATTMAEGTQEQAKAMADGTVVSATTMAADAEAQALEMATQIIMDAQQMQADTVAAADAMNTDAVRAISEMATDTGTAFESIEEPAQSAVQAMEEVGQVSIEAPDVSDVLSAMRKIEDAAKKARSALKDVDKGGSGSGGSKELSKRASGGWTQGLTLVGEEGPELISPTRPMFVTPNSQLGSGGGGATETIRFVISSPDGRTLEEWYVKGHEMAVQRGRA